MTENNSTCAVCGKSVSFFTQALTSDGSLVHFGCQQDYLSAEEAKAATGTEALPQLLISTTFTIDGYRVIQNIGLVRGSTVRARNVGSDIGAGLKSIVGGELKGATKLMADAREQALARMLREAVSLNANAIIGLKFSTSQVWEGAAEVMVYGTAVIVESVRPELYEKKT